MPSDKRPMRLTTTLNLLREAGACEGRYRHLVKALGGTKFDHDAPIDLRFILEHNGVGDVEWVLEEGATVEDCVPLSAEYERQYALLWAEYERQYALRQYALLWAEYQRQITTLLAEHERQRVTLLAALLEASNAA